MSLLSFLSWIFGGPAPASLIPPAPADTLGAATLPAAGIPVSAIGDAPELPEAAIALVKRWEGFRAKPYLCPAGVPTIGYGATFYLTGRAVTLQDPPIGEAEATILLRKMLAKFAGDVRAVVKVPLTPNELGALTSLAFNIGVGAFGKSTLLRKLNAGDRAGAAEQFGVWKMGGGKVLPGLVSRRAEEAALFRKP